MTIDHVQTFCASHHYNVLSQHSDLPAVQTFSFTVQALPYLDNFPNRSRAVGSLQSCHMFVFYINLYCPKNGSVLIV